MSRVEPGRIRAENLGRRFEIAAQGGRSLRATLLRREHARPREFWALRHVDLDVAPGETFGIVGRNGSGKSTLLKMLARIFGPTEGSCEVGGRLSSLLELGAGFHPEFSAVENIYLSAAIYGIPRDEVHREIESIIDFAELEEFKDQPVKTFSSGMFARLGFSVAMHVKPDVLLLDEVLAVGDEAFVQKCMGRIAEYQRNGGTMLLVSHDATVVQRVCDRALFLEDGLPVIVGASADVIDRYREHLSRATRGEAHVAAGRSALSSGEARVDRIEVEGHGLAAGCLHQHRPGVVRVHFTADRDLDDVIFGIGFMSRGGIEVTGPNSTRMGPVSISRGEGVAEFGMGSVLLAPGGYDVSAAIVSESRMLDLWERALRIEVVGEPSSEPGVVFHPGSWTIEKGHGVVR